MSEMHASAKQVDDETDTAIFGIAWIFSGLGALLQWGFGACLLTMSLIAIASIWISGVVKAIKELP